MSANRAATEEVRVRFDIATYRALQEHAALRKEPVAAVVRRFVARGLVNVSSDAQSQALADAVRGVIREELKPTRHYAYLAAREAMRSHRYGIGLVGILVTNVLRWPADRRAAALDQSEAAARRYAAQHMGEDTEPDDLSLDAPAKPLPRPEDEVTVEDEDTAAMLKGV